MKIKTEILQQMVAKAIQGASNNKIIPLTSLIGIEVISSTQSKEQSTLILTTTDGSNQFKVTNEIEKTDEFYTIVNADTFSKLIAKTTKEFIELTNKENYLEVTGNGSYKLDIAINEEGEMVKFPAIKQLNTSCFEIDTKVLQEAIKVAKASVAKTMEIPYLTGYYLSDNLITTDSEMICIMNKKLIDKPVLIPSEIAELLLLVDNETISIYHEDNNLIFNSINFTIIGKELEGKENYPAKQITEVLNTNYTNTIKVNKQALLNVLDRMSLFVTDYDRNGIYLDFTEAGLVIRSQKSNAEEIVEIEGSLEPDDRFNCLADIEMLKSQIETISTDIVEIAYGQDTSIKIVDGNVTHIISLLEKE